MFLPFYFLNLEKNEYMEKDANGRPPDLLKYQFPGKRTRKTQQKCQKTSNEYFILLLYLTSIVGIFLENEVYQRKQVI